MPEEVVVSRDPETGVEECEIKCEVCGRTLAKLYRSSLAYKLAWTRECEHYMWEEFGNACYARLPCKECILGYDSEECNKIYENKVLVLYNGTKVYILVPASIIPKHPFLSELRREVTMLEQKFRDQAIKFLVEKAFSNLQLRILRLFKKYAIVSPTVLVEEGLFNDAKTRKVVLASQALRLLKLQGLIEPTETRGYYRLTELGKKIVSLL